MIVAKMGFTLPLVAALVLACSDSERPGPSSVVGAQASSGGTSGSSTQAGGGDTVGSGGAGTTGGMGGTTTSGSASDAASVAVASSSGSGGMSQGVSIGWQATDFSLMDVNPSSPRFNQAVSPKDYLKQVSGWYFGHAT